MATTIIFSLLFVLNVVAFFVFVADKHREQNEKERISASSLTALSICGGAYGAAMAMLLFKAANEIKKFKVLVPIALLLWLVLVVMLKCFM